MKGRPLILKEKGTAVLITFPRNGTSANQATTSAAATGVPHAQRLAEVATSPSEATSLLTAEGPTASIQNHEELQEVVVLGSHIRGVFNETVPSTIFDREDIDATGLTTTTRLIESLPQNFALNSQSLVQGLPSGATATQHQGSSINLRGLGQGTTLILPNGRRLAPGYSSTAVDISALPLTAVDRVEILTDGASALYGSDAVGGVVNFVLRHDFDGFETRIRQGWADQVEETRIGQVAGKAWASGNAVASAEYSATARHAWIRQLIAAIDIRPVKFAFA